MVTVKEWYNFTHDRINYDFKITQTHSNNNTQSGKTENFVKKINFVFRIKTFSFSEYGKNESLNFIPNNVVL